MRNGSQNAASLQGSGAATSSHDTANSHTNPANLFFKRGEQRYRLSVGESRLEDFLISWGDKPDASCDAIARICMAVATDKDMMERNDMIAAIEELEFLYGWLRDLGHAIHREA